MRSSQGLRESLRRRARFGGVALSLFLANVSGAQTPVPSQGDRVRVKGAATNGQHVTATLADIDTVALTLAVKNQTSPLVVPWSGVTRLAVSTPRTRIEGAVHSAKWGLAMGAVLGVLSVLGPPLEDETMSELELALGSPVQVAFLGAVWGAVRPGRRWHAVNVAEARESATRPAATEPVADRRVVEATDSLRAGTTPSVEWTAGASAPRSQHAQFPGLGVQLAVNYGWKPRLGIAFVGDALAELHHTAVLGGARIYGRSAPLFSGGGVLTYFGQILAGKMRAESSGVVRSTGGPAIQPGIGIDYGRSFVALRIQVDRIIVRDGLVYDDRVPGGPVGKLTSTRLFFGSTVRLPSW